MATKAHKGNSEDCQLGCEEKAVMFVLAQNENHSHSSLVCGDCCDGLRALLIKEQVSYKMCAIEFLQTGEG
jgi:hypothetical protein